jgi:transcriptional regulator GlxA family with amidase domain
MFFRNRPRKTIAVVFYPGMTALDVVGTMEALVGLNLDPRYRFVSVGKTIDPVRTDTPLKLVPNLAFSEMLEPYGLIVPGGETAVAASGDAALLSWIRYAGATAEVIASVGTGSLLLAAAGLLDGKQATTHWQHATTLGDLGARYVRQRVVEDGKIITAAGVTAGIDMALRLMARLTSVSAARRSQLVIEYDPQPPHGGIDWRTLDTTGVVEWEQAS